MLLAVHPSLHPSTEYSAQDDLMPCPADVCDTVKLVTLQEEMFKNSSENLWWKVKNMCHSAIASVSRLGQESDDHVLSA